MLVVVAVFAVVIGFALSEFAPADRFRAVLIVMDGAALATAFWCWRFQRQTAEMRARVDATVKAAQEAVVVQFPVYVKNILTRMQQDGLIHPDVNVDITADGLDMTLRGRDTADADPGERRKSTKLN